MPIYSFRVMGWFPDFLLYYAMLSTDTRLDPQRQELWEGLGDGRRTGALENDNLYNCYSVVLMISRKLVGIG